MPAITALLHTKNDALRLGRALEMLYLCDDIVIVDHGSDDGTVQLASKYGAHVFAACEETSPEVYLESARQNWILCLDPHESLSERLVSTLYEWKSQQSPSSPAFSLYLREETAAGWVAHPIPQTRLVPSDWSRWNGTMPVNDPSSPALDGELLRFAFP